MGNMNRSHRRSTPEEPRTRTPASSRPVRSFLRDLSDEHRRQLLSIGRSRRFIRGEVVFHEGDPGDTVHLIRKGRVAIRVTSPMGDVLTLAVLESGEPFGELALFDPEARRSATVIALEATDTLALRRDDFLELRQTNPEMEGILVNILVEQIRRLSDLLLEAVYVPAEKRLLRRLIALAELYKQGYDGTDIPFRQEDLANLAGTSRATVNRVLRDAERDGLVRIHRGGVTLLDPEKLAARAR